MKSERLAMFSARTHADTGRLAAAVANLPQLTAPAAPPGPSIEQLATMGVILAGLARHVLTGDTVDAGRDAGRDADTKAAGRDTLGRNATNRRLRPHGKA